jgi:HAD superfamily hydrolase (TIGR01490 family)
MPEPHTGQTVAAFDFDGTLTRSDTFFGFIRFVRGDFRFFAGLIPLAPTLIAFIIGRLPNYVAKERVLTYYFGGMPASELWHSGQLYAEKKIPSILRPETSDLLRKHQAMGHRCLLVTASLNFWTKDWAESNGLELISSRPEIVNGLFTGKLAGKNCHGKEKVRRIMEHLNGIRPEKVFAYGDSKAGDGPMIEWADEGMWVE